jgi:hypothetical protein
MSAASELASVQGHIYSQETQIWHSLALSSPMLLHQLDVEQLECVPRH